MKEEVKILIEKIMPHYTANSEPEIGPYKGDRYEEDNENNTRK